MITFKTLKSCWKVNINFFENQWKTNIKNLFNIFIFRWRNYSYGWYDDHQNISYPINITHISFCAQCNAQAVRSDIFLLFSVFLLYSFECDSSTRSFSLIDLFPLTSKFSRFYSKKTFVVARTLILILLDLFSFSVFVYQFSESKRLWPERWSSS